MTYVSNHTADIAIKAKQRAQLDAEYKAYIKQRRPVTVAPGYPAGHRDIRSLQTYYNETAESMARLL